VENPFRVTLYDKNLTRVGWVNDPTSLTVTPRHNQIATATIVVPSGHRQLPNLNPHTGSRVVIDYNDERVFSGVVTEAQLEGPTVSGTYTATVRGDLWLLWRMVGWPVPGAAINAQGVKKDVRTGPAETVAKAFITANLPHVVDDVTVIPTAGRGATITAESRMAVLAEAFLEQVDKAGVGISVTQGATSLVVDAYTPAMYPRALSEDAGTVISYDLSAAAHAATRTIVGGPGENTSREFREVVSATREAELGYTVNVFTDASSVDLGAYTDMDAAGQATLAANGRKSGFRLALSETSVFRYGGADGVRVGDQVTVTLGGATYTDVLREATLLFDRDNGPAVTPTIGEHSDDPDKRLARYVAAAMTGIRKLQRR
jgi:hypothetical protein